MKVMPTVFVAAKSRRIPVEVRQALAGGKIDGDFGRESHKRTIYSTQSRGGRYPFGINVTESTHCRGCTFQTTRDETTGRAL